jgi:iron complex outermembrane receptor protein
MGTLKNLLLYVSLAVSALHVNAQEDSTSVDLLKMSFEDLMNVKIVSASKEEELFFESPVTSYVITRQDIINNGSTSIPEALRLAPALIVREIANGTYDVSIRGGKDNLPSHRVTYLNNSILAMIDNRPVFNYFQGGTNWLNLPIGLADIERIEIVYGPNSPLYGPNAVDGVINIITRKGAKNEKLTYGTASFMAGENTTFSGLAGTRISEKLEVNVSGNHGTRKRMKKEFYDASTDSFITNLREHSNPLVSANPYSYYPDPELGSKHTGINFNLFYTPRKKTTLTFTSGLNESSGLFQFSGGVTMNQVSNTSVSNLFKAEIGNFTFQSSLLQGRHDLIGNISQYNFNYTTWDNYIDYNFKLNRKFSLRPALSFQDAVIDDRDYTMKVGSTGLFNNRANMSNYAFSLKADYSPAKALRIITAVRADKFSDPNDMYISYQGIANYKINDKTILRFLAGRSFGGSFIEPAYINLVLADDESVKVSIKGNKEMNLLQNNIVELGYRAQIGKKGNLDLSIFQQTYTNFAIQTTTITQEFIPFPYQRPELESRYRNIDLASKQTGATLAGAVFFGKANIKASITYQKTQLSDYSPYTYEPHPMYPEFNTENVVDKESEYAPDVFGNLSLTIPVKKWHFNISSYYYSGYKLDGSNSADPFLGGLLPKEIENITGKVLINANVGYRISSRFKLFVNARNVTGQPAREGYGTDQIGTLLFAGFNLTF